MTNKLKTLIPFLMICIIALMCSCVNKDSSEIIQNSEQTKGEMIYRNWQETIQDKETMRRAEISHDGYNRVVEGFKQELISDNVRSNASEEYRIVYSISRNRYEYYSLTVFPDGTGRFRLMINAYEVFKKGSIVLDDTKDLSSDDVNSLLNVLQENDFWNIPTIHPGNKIGVDGRSIHVEGYKNEKTYYITMSMPDEEDEIKKIYREFSAFANTFATKLSPSEYPFMQIQD